MVKCPECDRVFDLMDKTDADEWSHGHDCAVKKAFNTGWSVVKGREPCSKCGRADKENYCAGCGRCSDCCPDWEGHGRGA